MLAYIQAYLVVPVGLDAAREILAAVSDSDLRVSLDGSFHDPSAELPTLEQLTTSEGVLQLRATRSDHDDIERLKECLQRHNIESIIHQDLPEDHESECTTELWAYDSIRQKASVGPAHRHRIEFYVPFSELETASRNELLARYSLPEKIRKHLN